MKERPVSLCIEIGGGAAIARRDRRETPVKFAGTACATITADRTQPRQGLLPVCVIGMTLRDLLGIPVGTWKEPLPGDGTQNLSVRLELGAGVQVPGITYAS